MICDECETVAHCMKNGCVPRTTKKDEALKLALEALEWEEAQTSYPSRMMIEALTALREALASEAIEQPAPVAEPLFKTLIDLHPGLAEELKAMDTAQQKPGRNHWEDGDVFDRIAAIKEQPAQRQARSADTWVHATAWRGLTDDEVKNLCLSVGAEPIEVRLIEAKLKEKNT